MTIQNYLFDGNLVQDIFITKMALEGQQLVIWNQRNDNFLVDLKTREVKPKNKVYP
jgi:hypothetical protein